MKTPKLINAMEYIDDELISAAETYRPGRRKPVLLRWGAAAACLVLVFAASFGTALAVSEDLRSTVFEFFHIAQAEEVPPLPGIEQGSSEAEISGGIRAYYIDLDMDYLWNVAQDGLLYRVSHENGENTGLFSVDGTQLQELECREVSFEYDWDGHHFSGSVLWAEYGGGIAAYGSGKMPGSDLYWYVGSEKVSSEEIMLYLSRGRHDDYCLYPLIFNPGTGELRAPLEGVDTSAVGALRIMIFSDDLRYAVLWGMPEGGQKVQPYFCDIAANSLTPLQELTGTGINGAVRFFGSKLLISSYTDEFGVSCWVYETTNGGLTKTVDNMPLDNTVTDSHGLLMLGGRYAPMTDDSDRISVMDLMTGAISAPIDGFTYGDNMAFISDSTGDKALCYTSERKIMGLGISQLGVIDFRNATFTIFDREGFENNNEWSLQWLDDSRVCIHVAGSEDGLYKECLYIYDFSA